MDTFDNIILTIHLNLENIGKGSICKDIYNLNLLQIDKFVV
jgi:hypothetical protein